MARYALVFNVVPHQVSRVTCGAIKPTRSRDTTDTDTRGVNDPAGSGRDSSASNYRGRSRPEYCPVLVSLSIRLGALSIG